MTLERRRVTIVNERFNIVEGARRLGISKFTVRALIRRRELAAYRIGRRLVLDSETIERFLAERRLTSGAGVGR